MSISTLPLCYCTNVHAWRSVEEIETGLAEVTKEVGRLAGQPLSAGLWFSDAVSRELAGDAGRIQSLGVKLGELNLHCHTLNAFPFGDFHDRRVKERVYRPDWTEPERVEYTLRCARILAELMPEGREGSISTVPLGFKESSISDDFWEVCCRNLCDLAGDLDELHSDTGRIVRLAIEPEPFCRIETTQEAVDFFERLRDQAESRGMGDVVEQHIGLCYDVCHQAVEFEEISSSIAALNEAGIRINKVQISSAIELADPANNAEGRTALAEYAEPRYLHQTFARRGESIARRLDLDADLCHDPSPEFREAEAWRVHFHVPVNEETIGPLDTTRRHVREALGAVAKLEYAPHLEVETYTWSVMPGKGGRSLAEGLAQELRASSAMIDELG